MKKVIGLLAFAGLVFFACGPSAAEKAAEEKRVQDSIAQVEAAALEAEALVEAAALEAEALVKAAEVEAEAAALAAKEGNKTVKKAAAKKAEPAAPEKPAAKPSRMQGATKTQ